MYIDKYQIILGDGYYHKYTWFVAWPNHLPNDHTVHRPELGFRPILTHTP